MPINNTPGDPILLTIEMVAALVNMSPSTIRRREADGSFPPPRKRRGPGSRALWHRDDITRWARKRER